MSDKVEDVVIPILRNLQADISILKEDVAVLKESVRRIDGRLSSMDHYMAGFYSEQRWQNDEIDALRGRIEHLEDRPDPENNPD